MNKKPTTTTNHTITYAAAIAAAQEAINASIKEAGNAATASAETLAEMVSAYGGINLRASVAVCAYTLGFRASNHDCHGSTLQDNERAGRWAQRAALAAFERASSL